MATKKQQQRKYQRAREHARRERAEGDEPRPERKPTKSSKSGRGGRTPQPANLMRAAKRAALFAIGIFLAVQVVPIFGKLSPAAAAVQAGIFFLWLVPFGYVMDGFLYRRWVKNQ